MKQGGNLCGGKPFQGIIGGDMVYASSRENTRCIVAVCLQGLLQGQAIAADRCRAVVRLFLVHSYPLFGPEFDW